MYTVKGNLLNISGKQLMFDYEIRIARELGDFVVVLLAIPFGETFLDNVYAVNRAGEIAWRIQDAGEVYPLKDRLPYEHLHVDETNQVFVSDFYGRRFKAEPFSGRITGKDFVK